MHNTELKNTIYILFYKYLLKPLNTIARVIGMLLKRDMNTNILNGPKCIPAPVTTVYLCCGISFGGTSSSIKAIARAVISKIIIHEHKLTLSLNITVTFYL